MYTCKKCGESFSSTNKLGDHTKQHHPRKKGVCEICGKEFPNGGLGGHMVTVHPKNGVPHGGIEYLKKSWAGLSEEEHTARSNMFRASKFAHLDNITITDFQRQMILGSLLGDMVIWKQGKKTTKYGLANPELRISHSTKQREYVMWKYEILKDIARKEPYEFVQKAGFGAGCGTCRFETKSLPCLNSIYDVVIKDGKKHISQEWLDQITDPIALATWFMDDGSNWWRYMYFSIGLLPQNEYTMLQRWLLNSYGIETSIDQFTGSYNGNTYSNLIIKNEEEFASVVRSNIIPSLKYKLGDWE